MFASIKTCYIIIISGVLTLLWVLVRLPDDGCQQPKHVAEYWCHVYVLVCASCWSYELK